MGSVVDPKGSDRRIARFFRRLFPPKMSLDARHQFARTKRLGDVIVSSEFQAKNAVHFIGPGRQKQNGSARQRRCFANLTAELKAIDIGQHDIENNEIRLPGFEIAQRSRIRRPRYGIGSHCA